MDFKEILQYTSGLDILYVEDDSNLLEETVDILEDYFDSIDTATNGAIALEKYKAFYKNNDCFYDLVITDINMPIMDGETLINEIKLINKFQDIIVISAYNESNRLIKFIQNGISNFMMKPIDSKQLLETLYSTCQNIFTKKRVEQYREELENINSTLEKKVKEQTAEINSVQQISIEMIADMIEGYDSETGAHVKRIEAYTEILSLEVQQDYNISEMISDFIPFASLLHDIGKMLIPKEILNKPSSLTKDEFEVIKTHSKLGGDILMHANQSFYDKYHKDSYLKTASQIAMHHHEKWDGSGYPYGLKGKDIPLCARVVAIADVYDALRSKRLYKEGFSHEKSKEIIKIESGKSFDPNLVDIFLKYDKKFDEIFTKLY